MSRQTTPRVGGSQEPKTPESASREQNPKISQEDLQVPAADGFPLAVTLFQPAQSNGHMVQIHPATAVQRGIYVNYARFLAAEGFVVLTLDYRGTGGSLPGSLRSFKGRMRDWGELDLVGMTQFMAERFPTLRHHAVAHSVGGQLLGLMPNADRLESVWAVAAQWGAWRLWPAPRRYLHKGFSWLTPGLVATFGYFPGRLLGMGDLPAGIGAEWMRWCGSDFYIVDDRGEPYRPHFDRLRARVKWNAFADDLILGPKKAVAHMANLYPNARSEFQLIEPKRVDSSIGHFGFFRSRFRDNLWRESRDWLLGC